MIKYFWNQKDEIFLTKKIQKILWPNWWNIFAINQAKVEQVDCWSQVDCRSQVDCQSKVDCRSQVNCWSQVDCWYQVDCQESIINDIMSDLLTFWGFGVRLTN